MYWFCWCTCLPFRLKTVGLVCRSVIFNEDRSCIFDKWIPGDCRSLLKQPLSCSYNTWRWQLSRRRRSDNDKAALAWPCGGDGGCGGGSSGCNNASLTIYNLSIVVLVVVVFVMVLRRESNSLVASLDYAAAAFIRHSSFGRGGVCLRVPPGLSILEVSRNRRTCSS